MFILHLSEITIELIMGVCPYMTIINLKSEGCGQCPTLRELNRMSTHSVRILVAPYQTVTAEVSIFQQHAVML